MVALDVELDPPEHMTFDVDADERRRTYEAGWETGGVALFFSFQVLFSVFHLQLILLSISGKK